MIPEPRVPTRGVWDFARRREGGCREGSGAAKLTDPNPAPPGGMIPERRVPTRGVWDFTRRRGRMP